MTPDQHDPRSVDSTDRGPVVALRAPRAAHGAATRWSRTLAETLQTDVVVVRPIKTPRLRANVLFPQRNLTEGLALARDAQRVMTARARWQRKFAGAGDVPAMLSLSEAGPNELVDAMRPLRPSIIVVPACEAWAGDAVTRLVRDSGVPVLVVRAGSSTSPIVAASNLADTRAPVLRQAAEWAHVLGRELTVVHNLEPVAVEWAGDGAVPGVLRATEQELALRRVQEAERLAALLSADLEVSRRADPVGGILEAASRDTQALIVVGAPEKRAPVAEGVVTQAGGSVLVVPVPRAGL